MTRYSSLAMILHWLIAVLILGNLVLGLRMGGAHGLAQFQMFQLHKSLGISVLLLSLVRIAWRLANPPPPLSAALRPWERVLARITHGAFYLAMIALPLTGWLIVSASKFNLPTLLFGTVPWPHIAPVHAASIAERARIEGVAGSTHEVLAWMMIALIVLHVAGALKHQFVDRDGIVGRMLPGRAPKSERLFDAPLV